MTSRMIPLDQLRFGHEAPRPINARKFDRDADVSDLAASIAAHGLAQPLKVEQQEGTWYVGIGNRRLKALRLLAGRGELPGDAEIECTEFDVSANAREVALAEQIMRLPLHEADQYEEFYALSDSGLGEDDIAARFGIEKIRVRRMLALGRLSPVILAAWRKGDLGHRQADVVKAFTLANTPKQQERVFAKLKKDGQLWPDSIRRALGADNPLAAKWVRFVGKEAYVAAGGGLVEDLFGDGHVVLDAELAERLGAEKLSGLVEALKAEGWSWASVGSELPANWEHQWSTLTPDKTMPTAAERKEIKRLGVIVAVAEKQDASDAQEARAQAAETAIQQLEEAVAARGWTDALKAKGGAVVYLDHRGDVATKLGVLHPIAAKGERAKARKAARDRMDEAAGGAAPEPVPAPKISNAMMERLSVQATLGCRAALEDEPRLGLVALLAGFLAGGYHGVPVRVTHQGYGKGARADDRSDRREVESFAAAFTRLAEMDDAALFRVAASIAGQALDLSRFHCDHRPFDEASLAMVDALDAGRLGVALKEAFDAAGYFAGVPKPIVLAAIREALNADEARKAGRLKKAELVEFAVANLVPTGWLPPELRAATYAGPGAEAAAELDEAA